MTQTHIQNRQQTTANSDTHSLGQQLRHLGQQATQSLSIQFTNRPLVTAVCTGLAAGLLTDSSTLFRGRALSQEDLQLLVQELARLIPLSFHRCQQNQNLSFSEALQQLTDKSSHKNLLQIYFQSSRGQTLLSLCDQAVAQHWSESQINEAFVRSQYRGVDFRNFHRVFAGQQDESGANFARMLLGAYGRDSQSAELRNYLERQGIVSGVVQSATFSGLASSLSGRVLSSVVIGILSRSIASPIMRVGAAILCGAASSVGQVGFQAYWATRHMNAADRLRTLQNMEWDFKSAVVTGMFCGVSELFGSSLLSGGTHFASQSARALLNFAVFNVSAELVSDAAMNQVGIAAAYVQAEQEDVLGPQTLAGKWLEGAGQEIIGDHTTNITTSIASTTALGMMGVLGSLQQVGSEIFESSDLDYKISVTDLFDEYEVSQDLDSDGKTDLSLSCLVIDLRTSEERGQTNCLRGDSVIHLELRHEEDDKQSWDMYDLAERVAALEIDPQIPVFFLCSHGARSFEATREIPRILRRQNALNKIPQFKSIAGGFAALKKHLDGKTKKEQSPVAFTESFSAEEGALLNELHAVLEGSIPDLENIVLEKGEYSIVPDASKANEFFKKYYDCAKNEKVEISDAAFTLLVLLAPKLSESNLEMLLKLYFERVNTDQSPQIDQNQYKVYRFLVSCLPQNSDVLFWVLTQIESIFVTPKKALHYFLPLYERMQTPLSAPQILTLALALGSLRESMRYEKIHKGFKTVEKADEAPSVVMITNPEFVAFKKIQDALIEKIQNSVLQECQYEASELYAEIQAEKLEKLMLFAYTYHLGFEEAKRKPWLALAIKLQRDYERQASAFHKRQVLQFYAQCIDKLMQKNSTAYFPIHRHSQLSEALKQHTQALLEHASQQDLDRVDSALRAIENVENPLDVERLDALIQIPEAHQWVQKLDVEQLLELIQQDRKFQIVDLRDDSEVEAQGNVLFNENKVTRWNVVLQEDEDRDWNVESFAHQLKECAINGHQPLVFVCSSGGRSFNQARDALRMLEREGIKVNWDNVYSLSSGMNSLLMRAKHIRENPKLRDNLSIQHGPDFWKKIQAQAKEFSAKAAPIASLALFVGSGLSALSSSVQGVQEAAISFSQMWIAESLVFGVGMVLYGITHKKSDQTVSERPKIDLLKSVQDLIAELWRDYPEWHEALKDTKKKVLAYNALSPKQKQKEESVRQRKKIERALFNIEQLSKQREDAKSLLKLVPEKEKRIRNKIEAVQKKLLNLSYTDKRASVEAAGRNLDEIKSDLESNAAVRLAMNSKLQAGFSKVEPELYAYSTDGGINLYHDFLTLRDEILSALGYKSVQDLLKFRRRLLKIWKAFKRRQQ